KQNTPSEGFHYIFYVDAEQKKHIKSRTTITYQGVKYNMDVKFDHGLCNCAPSKIEGYGNYTWTERVGREAQEHPKAPRRALRDDHQQARYSTNHHEGNRPTGRGGSHYPN
ncbi:MAG: hypothetical protein ACKPKO_34880, partial [Candidatus Fonsibacter sp.]